MQTFSQKYYSKKFLKIMAGNDAVRLENKELEKFGGEAALKAWFNERGWVFYILKVESPNKVIVSNSLILGAKDWQDILAIISNAIEELRTGYLGGTARDKVRNDILRQYQERRSELVGQFMAGELEVPKKIDSFSRIVEQQTSVMPGVPLT